MPKTTCRICGKKEFARKLCQSHWYRWRTYGDPLHEINHSQQTGYEGERNVAVLLRASGRDASVVRGNKPFDLLVDGWRVEVKTAKPQTIGERLEWQFHIARKSVLNERTDFYIFRFEGIPHGGAWAVHMLFRAPLNVSCVTISMRGLVAQGYFQHVEDFNDFTRGRYGRKEIAA